MQVLAFVSFVRACIVRSLPQHETWHCWVPTACNQDIPAKFGLARGVLNPSHTIDFASPCDLQAQRRKASRPTIKPASGACHWLGAKESAKRAGGPGTFTLTAGPERRARALESSRQRARSAQPLGLLISISGETLQHHASGLAHQGQGESGRALVNDLLSKCDVAGTIALVPRRICCGVTVLSPDFAAIPQLSEQSHVYLRSSSCLFCWAYQCALSWPSPT